MKLGKIAIGVAVSCGALGLLGTSNVRADEQMHRMYNPNSGEHFYTANVTEKQHLVSVGWKYEGIGWVAPTGDSRGDAVYRLYNRNSGDHHYTLSAVERDWLVKLGWSYEGIGWYSAKPEQGVPLYRLYNPYAKVGTHHYTLALSERDWLVPKGWRAEGIGWYAVKNSSGGNNGSTVTNPVPIPSSDGNYIPDGVTQLGNSGKLFSWAKADEWSRAQIADSGSKWYGYKVVLKAVYKDDHLVGFSPDFSKDNSGGSSTSTDTPTTNSDGSSPIPDGVDVKSIGNSGKFFERIEDASAWAEKQVNDASSKYYEGSYMTIAVQDKSGVVGYSVDLFEKRVDSGGNTDTTNKQLIPDSYILNDTAIGEELLRLLNEDRLKLGLNALKWDKDIYECAKVRAKELQISYSHTRPNGLPLNSIKDDLGLTSSTLLGENGNITSRGATDKEIASNIYNSWLSSTEHKSNMYNTMYSKVAISSSVGYRDYNGIKYKSVYTSMLLGL